ncbi:GntG family PLP-dependent aldolase [Pollutimonas sp. H1-120]|uniref:threonine aldolase family protein n=1 Tax=Pollutimonas sp. H1-120 TaxID=3148824 RepID=UPI003B5198DA
MSVRPPFAIDLVSDTATRPSLGMRDAMARAEVGDEQRGEDPSVNALTEKVAAILGQEAAIFLPSGTMCNQIALAVHCRPGDEIIAARNSHIVSSEGAGASVFAHSVIRGIGTEYGIFDAKELAAAVRPQGIKTPFSKVVCIEQTSNRGGGAVWPLETVHEVVGAARDLKLALHMDGARLLNACVATNVSAESYAKPFDSVWLDLSKGLGCPIGAVLAGSAEFIQQANRWKHRFGGAMRQAGIVAAAGLYALEHNVGRLAEDHLNARAFAERIRDLPGVRLQFGRVDTNLVFFDVSDSGKTAAEIARGLAQHDIRIGVESQFLMRAVFHLDISAKMTGAAVDALKAVLA